MIFSMAMVADYSFEVKNIEMWVSAFFKHNNSSVATVSGQIFIPEFDWISCLRLSLTLIQNMSKHVLKCWYLILNVYTVKLRAENPGLCYLPRLGTLQYVVNCNNHESSKMSKLVYNQYDINWYNSYDSSNMSKLVQNQFDTNWYDLLNMSKLVQNQFVYDSYDLSIMSKLV